MIFKDSKLTIIRCFRKLQLWLYKFRKNIYHINKLHSIFRILNIQYLINNHKEIYKLIKYNTYYLTHYCRNETISVKTPHIHHAIHNISQLYQENFKNITKELYKCYT